VVFTTGKEGNFDLKSDSLTYSVTYDSETAFSVNDGITIET